MGHQPFAHWPRSNEMCGKTARRCHLAVLMSTPLPCTSPRPGEAQSCEKGKGCPNPGSVGERCFGKPYLAGTPTAMDQLTIAYVLKLLSQVQSGPFKKGVGERDTFEQGMANRSAGRSH